MTIPFKGAGKPRDRDDLMATALHLGIPLAAFKAVVEVEARSSGFDARGRPTALFERHIFWRQLRDTPSRQARAVAEGLAYPKWGQKPYPKGSDGVYDEIQRACEIDREAALMSTSWGMGQIMGFNYRMPKCRDVEHLVEEAMESESLQLYHMAAFIKEADLAGDLKRLDWAAFARGYNGPGYARNGYDKKLAEAYKRFV